MKKNGETKTSRPLPYRLTNDYLFRAVFQTREKAREGLCRAILHLPMEADVKTEVRNPIELGQKIERKEFILDLSVIVNSYIYLNLEMQMYRDPNWTERSISYTCRSYDSLNHGDSYGEVLPVIHTGFIDYDLFPEHPQFVSNYLLTDSYSSAFGFTVTESGSLKVCHWQRAGFPQHQFYHTDFAVNAKS